MNIAFQTAASKIKSLNVVLARVAEIETRIPAGTCHALASFKHFLFFIKQSSNRSFVIVMSDWEMFTEVSATGTPG